MPKSSAPKSRAVRASVADTDVAPAESAWGRGRALLLEAARELFAEKGYAATSTKELAARARVTEPMLFRHFGSKAGLFREVTFAQFGEFMDRFVTDWEQRPHGVRDAVDEARDFLRGVYNVLRANRQMVTAFIAADTGEGPLASEEGPGVWLASVLDRFEPIAIREAENRNWRHYDPQVITRILFGMGFSAAVLDLQPGPTADSIIDEMAKLIIYGVEGEPRRKG